VLIVPDATEDDGSALFHLDRWFLRHALPRCSRFIGGNEGTAVGDQQRVGRCSRLTVSPTDPGAGWRKEKAKKVSLLRTHTMKSVAEVTREVVGRLRCAKFA
jgi:hypothetical protein